MPKSSGKWVTYRNAPPWAEQKDRIMATCSSCNGKCAGTNPALVTPKNPSGKWTCESCGGTGREKQPRRVRRMPTARQMMTAFEFREAFPPVPKALNKRGDWVGAVAGMVPDEGCMIDHGDGTLWNMYLWAEIGNAAEIKAAFAALPDRKAA